MTFGCGVPTQVAAAGEIQPLLFLTAQVGSRYLQGLGSPEGPGERKA